MSTLWPNEWAALFSEGLPYNRGADDFLLSAGINSFQELRLAVDASRFGAELDRSTLEGWLDVVQTLGQTTRLNSSSRALCHDLAETICKKLSERVSILEDRARIFYEWAKINRHRGNFAESLANIIEARRLDYGHLEYALWHAKLIGSNYRFEVRDDLVAIYEYCLVRSATLAKTGEMTREAAAYYQACAHIGLGDAGAGDPGAHYREAIVLAESRGDRDLDLKSQALIGLGNLFVSKREWFLARKYFRQALQLARAIGHVYLEVLAYTGLGDAHDHRKRYYGIALGLAQAIGNRNLQAEVLIRLGDLAEASGELASAEECFWLALLHARAIENQSLQVEALIRSGNVAIATRDWDFAREYFNQALQLNIRDKTKDRILKELRKIEEAQADSGQEELREALYEALNDLTLELIFLLQETRALRSSRPDPQAVFDGERGATAQRLLRMKDTLAVKISATFNELKLRAGVSEQGKTATGLQRTLKEEETDRGLCKKCGVENWGLQLINQLVRRPFAEIEKELRRELAPPRTLSQGR
jgi:tetratricopeptide (TPR) repeat protein